MGSEFWPVFRGLADGSTAASGGSCRKSSECGDGEFCCDNVCTDVGGEALFDCNESCENGGCGSGRICCEGSCVPAGTGCAADCANDTDCPDYASGDRCCDGKCIPGDAECITPTPGYSPCDPSCGEGESCCGYDDNGNPTCLPDDECGTTFRCKNGRCPPCYTCKDGNCVMPSSSYGAACGDCGVCGSQGCQPKTGGSCGSGGCGYCDGMSIACSTVSDEYGKSCPDYDGCGKCASYGKCVPQNCRFGCNEAGDCHECIDDSDCDKCQYCGYDSDSGLSVCKPRDDEHPAYYPCGECKNGEYAQYDTGHIVDPYMFSAYRDGCWKCDGGEPTPTAKGSKCADGWDSCYSCNGEGTCVSPCDGKSGEEWDPETCECHECDSDSACSDCNYCDTETHKCVSRTCEHGCPAESSGDPYLSHACNACATTDDCRANGGCDVCADTWSEGGNYECVDFSYFCGYGWDPETCACNECQDASDCGGDRRCWSCDGGKCKAKDGTVECGSCLDGTFTASPTKPGSDQGSPCTYCADSGWLALAKGEQNGGCLVCRGESDYDLAEKGKSCGDCKVCDGAGNCVADKDQDGQVCGDGCSSCSDGECRPDLNRDGPRDACNVCRDGKSVALTNDELEGNPCQRCDSGSLKSNPDVTAECYTCSGGNVKFEPLGTDCGAVGSCSKCDGNGYCELPETVCASGEWDSQTCECVECSASTGKGCNACQTCSSEGKCVADSSKDGTAECGTCSNGAFTPRTGELDECSTCENGVKTAKPDGTAAGPCRTCAGGAPQKRADGVACGDCHVCSGGDCVGTTGELDECNTCVNGVKTEKADGTACGSGCGTCQGGKCEDKTCTYGCFATTHECKDCTASRHCADCGKCADGKCEDQRCEQGCDAETHECNDCPYGYNNTADRCNECDPNSSGQSTCPPCKACGGGMCVADPDAAPDCGTCSNGAFTPRTGELDECSTCENGVKTPKAKGTGCAACKACDGAGDCVADSSKDGARVGNTCQVCSNGVAVDTDSLCGPCQKCSDGSCVADSSKDGTMVGEGTCGTCSAGVFTPRDSDCGNCQKCGDSGKCGHDESKEGAECGDECGICRGGDCVASPGRVGESCHGGCGRCSAEGNCVADKDQDGQVCGDGCSSCSDGKCLVDSALDGSACGDEGCGKCDGGECGADPDKAGQPCRDGCGKCSGASCSAVPGKEGADCGDAGCRKCHVGHCVARGGTFDTDGAECNSGCGTCSDGACVENGEKMGASCGSGGCGMCLGGDCVPAEDKQGAPCHDGCGACVGIDCEADTGQNDKPCRDVCGKCKDGDCVENPLYRGIICGGSICSVCQGGECKPDSKREGERCGGECGKCSSGDCVADSAMAGKPCHDGCGTCVGSDCEADSAMAGKPCGTSPDCNTCSSGDCTAVGAGTACNGGCGKCEVVGNTGFCEPDKKMEGKKLDPCNSCADGKKKTHVGTPTGDRACGWCADGKFTPDDADCAKYGNGSYCSAEGACVCRENACTFGGKCYMPLTAPLKTICGEECGSVSRGSDGACVCNCSAQCSTKPSKTGARREMDGMCEADPAKPGKCRCRPLEEDPCEPNPCGCGACTADKTKPAGYTCDCAYGGGSCEASGNTCILNKCKSDDGTVKDCGCGSCVKATGACNCMAKQASGCVPDGDTCKLEAGRNCHTEIDCGECGIGILNADKTGCVCNCDFAGCMADDAGKCRKTNGCTDDSDCSPRYCDRTWNNGTGRCVDCTADEHCEQACGGKCDTRRGTCKPAECEAGELCDPKTGCYVCKRNKDCTTGLCDAEANEGKGKCIECRENDTSKCKSKCDRCTNGKCTSKCNSDETCNEDKSRCEDAACKEKPDGTECGPEGAEKCKECEDGRCVSACPEGQACVQVDNVKVCGTCVDDAGCQATGDKCALCLYDEKSNSKRCQTCSDYAPGAHCDIYKGSGLCVECGQSSDCNKNGTDCMVCKVNPEAKTLTDVWMKCAYDDDEGDRLCADDKVCWDGKCVECKDDTDCQRMYPGEEGKELCSDGKCGPCANNADCDVGKVCKPGVGCVECVSNGDCAHVNECAECDPETNKCVDVCEKQGKHCLSNTVSSGGACVECTGPTDCKEDKGMSCAKCDELTGWTCVDRCELEGKVCEPRSGDCQDCDETQGSKTCSYKACEDCESGTCVDRCEKEGKYCNGAGDCVECLEHEHCPVGRSCRGNKCVACAENKDCGSECERCEGGECVAKECPEGTTCDPETGVCGECTAADMSGCVAKGMALSCASCSNGRCTSNCPNNSACEASGCAECYTSGDCGGDPCDPKTHKCVHIGCSEWRPCPTACQTCNGGVCVTKTCPGGGLCNPATGGCDCGRRVMCGCGRVMEDCTCDCNTGVSDPATGRECIPRGSTCTNVFVIATYDDGDGYWDDGRGGWDGPATEIV